MNKTFIFALIGSLLSVAFCKAEPQKQDPTLSKAVQATLLSLMDYMDKEDIEKIMSVYHPDGPTRSKVGPTVKMLFIVGDFKHELLSFSLVGADSDYAYVRAKQKTTLVKKPDVVTTVGTESEVDMLLAFKQHEKTWKIWQSLILSSSVK